MESKEDIMTFLTLIAIAACFNGWNLDTLIVAICSMLCIKLIDLFLDYLIKRRHAKNKTK